MSFEIKPAPYDRSGDKNPKWRGGQTVARDGRVLVYSPDHPFPNWKNYVYRYRLVVEKHIGRYLEKHEDVHHLNNDPSDDRLENLQVLTHSEHMRLTNQIDGWSKLHERCLGCGTTDHPHKARGFCEPCYEKRRTRHV